LRASIVPAIALLLVACADGRLPRDRQLATDRGARPLGAVAVRRLFDRGPLEFVSDLGTPTTLTCTADGRLDVIAFGGDRLGGTCRVTPEGRFCYELSDGRASCQTVTVQGATYSFFDERGDLRSTVRAP
jgi:hypothetical protein